MESKGNATEGGAHLNTAASGGGQPSFHDYLKANSNYQHQQQADLASFLMHGNATATRSTPGSPATFAGGLGFNSVCASPVLGPSLPQSPQAVAAFLGASASTQQQQQQQQYACDSTVNSTVQSATGSPTTSAYNNRRGLLNSMASLNMAPLPPPAIGTSMSADNVAQAFNASPGIADTANSMFSISSSFAAPVITGTHPSIPSLSVTGVPNPAPSIVPATTTSSTTATSSMSRAGAGSNPSLLAAHQAAIMSRQPQLTPNVSPDFLKRVEETKAKGLRIELDGIPSENAKSRVETQIKITLRLTTADGERATCWSHLALPELLVSREKFRHRFNKPNQTNGSGQMTHGDSTMPLSPQHVVHMEAKIICSSDPTRSVETCYGCIKREYKRSLRRKDARLRSTAPSTCTTPRQSRPGSPTFDASMAGTPGGVNRLMTGIMDSDWDEERIENEKKRIVIFNCNDLLDFSKGEVVLPTRITCYCRHHGEKVGFYICLTMRDYQGNELASYMSPPIMITDDHKSTKFKTDRSKSRTKPEYDRHHGDGNTVYANHALAGFASPLHGGSGNLHLVDGGSGSSLFNAHNRAAAAGGRQAFSARNSPTLRPYSHHALLDTYSHFASLAGTPSLESTPLGSPMLSAAHISGFDSPFNLPQAAALGGNYHQQPPGSATAAFFNNMSGSVYPSVTTAAAVAAAVAGTTPSQQLNANSATNSVYSSPAGIHMQQQSALPISPVYANMQQPQQSLGGGGGVTLGLQQTTAGLMDPGLFGSDSSGTSAAAAAAAAVAAAGLMPQMGGAEDLSRSSVQPMQINQLMPSQGPVAGGTTILISGRGFHPNIAVFFGEIQACRVQVLSSSNITCVLPPFRTPAPVSVKITDLLTMVVYDSTSPVSGAGVFTYMEDTDQAILELALQVMGLRQGGQQSQQQLGGGPLTVLGSPLMSPVMQAQGTGSPSSRKSSPTRQNASASAAGTGTDAQGLSSQQKQQMNRILQDHTIVTTLRVLRTASEARDLMEIENSLVRLFMMLQSRGMMDASRLSMRHETTGRTLLHFATLLGMRSLADFLVSRGVNIDDTENSGMTALHFAGMYAKRESIFELLLNSGASTVIRSGLGQTAGDVAKASGFTHLQRLAEERDGYINFIREENMAELGGNNNVQANDDNSMMRQSLAEMMSQMSAAGGSTNVGAQQQSSSGDGMFDSSMFFGGGTAQNQ
ncbi:SPT3 Dosage dependent suppressor of Ty-induced promoter mutations-like protein [Coemansia sp. RSA 487]|nr:SPT3 Dosage dependent suppressor of Ty-induced promoter mutations-like protein [Coemansia sp. RSA 487]